jgi:glyoxylase-like metal-dependent hydrolase (beta-lactamase superfamily II)
MNNITRTATQILLVGLIYCLLPIQLSNAQQKIGAADKSYQRARQTLEAGIQALGGLEAIAAIKSFTIVERANGYDAAQNPTPGPPYLKYDSVEKLTIDFARSRLRHELNYTRPHYSWRPLTIIDAGKGYRIDLWSNTGTMINNPSLSDYRHLFQKLPLFFLQEVLTERAASLRWLGEGRENGRKQNVITFIDRGNRQVALYFDAGTKQLTKYEYFFIDPAAGDTKSEFIYQRYGGFNGLKVPTGLINRIGDFAFSETRYEIEINPVLAEGEFALPHALQIVTPVPPPLAYTMTKIGRDIYLIENVGNRYNVMVVAFDDFILVAEAPEDRPQAGLSERVIAKIKEQLPGKPIKYLVFSHHHGDHGAGIRTYIAEGATIITAPGNRRFVEATASARFTMKPDLLARTPRPPSVQIIEKKKHIIRDAHHVVEFYDIGPYWHAEEEILVYVPGEKLLFEGDLFTSGFGEDVAPAQDHPILLAEKIKELGLDVRQIVGVHGRLRPIADLYRAIEKRQGKP